MNLFKTILETSYKSLPQICGYLIEMSVVMFVWENKS